MIFSFVIIIIGDIMIFILNSFVIDVIFVFFCIFFSLIGFFKGFIKRFYDLVGTILSFVLAYYLCDDVSETILFFPVNDLTNNIIIFPIVNNIISFILLFLAFYILKKILGIIIKPILENVVNFINITGFINRLLGSLLSFIESLIISYFVLLLMMTPIINNGYNLINDTVVAKEVLNIVPEYSSLMIDWSHEYMIVLENNLNIDNDTTADFIMSSYELGILKEEQLYKFIDDPQINENLRIEIKNKVSDLNEK